MIVTALIALETFFLYKKSRRQRVFILGLSMGFFTLTSLVSVLGDNHLLGTANTNWFKYIGQAACLLFIFLGNVDSSSEYLSKIMDLQKVVLGVLFLFMLATPLMPAFPNGTVQAVISSSRDIMSLLLLCQYGAFFFRKPTNFTMLMGFTFLLLAIGYTLIIPKFVLAHQDILSNEGDIVRIFGLAVLFIAYLM